MTGKDVEQAPGLSRRDALRTLAAGALGAASATFWIERLAALAQVQAAHHRQAATAAAAWTPEVLTTSQNEAVVALTELIIPQTDTPGAKAALVNRFVDAVLMRAQPADRDQFLNGLAWVDAHSRSLFGTDFVSAGPHQQSEILTRLSTSETASSEAREGVEFFQAIKSLTIAGYYSTEIGLRQELGDDGQLFLLEFEGCTHPEHQG